MAERSLFEYWLVLYRRRWIIVCLTLSAMAAAAVVSKVLDPVYEAKAVCFIPSLPDVTRFLSPTPDPTMAKSPLMPVATEEPNAPYIGLLKSRALAELTQKRFSHKNVGDLQRKDVDFTLSDEYLLEVYARDNDPAKAAGIANACVENLKKVINDYAFIPVSHNQTILDEEIRLTNEMLAEARRKLEEFQETNNTAQLEEETRQLIAQKAEFMSRLGATEIEKSENQSNITALSKQLEKEAQLFARSDLVVTSPLLEELRKSLADTNRRIAGIRAEINSSHPDYLSLVEQRDQIEKSVKGEIENILDSTIKSTGTFYEQSRQQLVGLLVNKERIHSSLKANRMVIADIDSRIKDIPKLNTQLDVLRTDVQKYRSQLDTLQVNLEELKLQGQRELQTVVVVDEAIPPPRPSFPILWLNLLVSFSCGLAVAILYVFFLNYVEETKHTRMLRLLTSLEKSKSV